jgi:hypothetical protein
MDYRDSDIAMVNNIRHVLEQKAMIGGRKKRSKKRGRGYSGGTQSGGTSYRQVRAMQHARAMKKKYKKLKNSKRGSGYDELDGGRRKSSKRRVSFRRGSGVLEGGYKKKKSSKRHSYRGRGVLEGGVLEGGRRPKRRVNRRRGNGYSGGMLTREEKEELLNPNVNPERISDILGIEQMRMRNPNISYEDLYAEAIGTLQAKQDYAAMESIKRIEQEQQLLNHQNQVYDGQKEKLALLVAQTQMSHAKSNTTAALKLRDAQRKIAAVSQSYSQIQNNPSGLITPFDYYDINGNPVYKITDKYNYTPSDVTLKNTPSDRDLIQYYKSLGKRGKSRLEDLQRQLLENID